MKPFTQESQQVDAHNAKQLVAELRMRLEVIEHEAGQIGGLLDDLNVYLPQVEVAVALNPNHRNDGFIR